PPLLAPLRVADPVGSPTVLLRRLRRERPSLLSQKATPWRSSGEDAGPRRGHRARRSLSLRSSFRQHALRPGSHHSCLTPLPSRSRSGLSQSAFTSTQTSPEAV